LKDWREVSSDRYQPFKEDDFFGIFYSQRRTLAILAQLGTVMHSKSQMSLSLDYRA
jgi:hypothetical protein